MEICVDFGDGTQEEIRKELDQGVNKVVGEGLSIEGVKKLKATLNGYFTILRVTLGSAEASKTRPVRITLYPTRTGRS